MMEQTFRLVLFPAPEVRANSIDGAFSLADNVLRLHYALSGDMGTILLPAETQNPSRKNELWTATCFEFFLAIVDEPAYWEFNLSPSGDWNVYRMDAYRRIGFREEPAITKLPFEVRQDPESLSLDVSVDLSPIVSPEAELEMGITAVVQTRDGQETYWALRHPAPQADFHLRQSFIPVRAGQRHPLGQSVRDD